MSASRRRLAAAGWCLLMLLPAANSINCYQCSGTDSNNPFECNEYLDGDTDLETTDCASIYNAQFCVKHVGRYEGLAIDCYQCNSSTTAECGDILMHLDGGLLKTESCKHVHNAQYCIKLTGGIATKRFCSSLDLGTYCHYVKHQGDKLEYRTCIYTCSADGCNSASSKGLSAVTMLIVCTILKYIR